MTDKVIMLIEDNKYDEELAIRALKKTKISNEIIVLNDGEEALDYLFAGGKYKNNDNMYLPTLILLDLKLPKIDGLEVLKEIKNNEKTKLIPVIILTTSDEESDIMKSYKLGCNSYIRKPVNFDEFYNVMNQLSMYWMVYNITPKKY